MNIKLEKLAMCKCGANELLPLEDTTRTNETPYLKGWFCPACGLFYYLKNGTLVIEQQNFPTVHEKL